MHERKLDWFEKIPVGIMQLGTNLDIILANEEVKRLLSLFQVPPSGGIPDELHSQLEIALNKGVIREGSVYSLLVKSPDERYVRFLVQKLEDDALILAAEDVTEFEWAKSEERTMREEIDRAFTFSLLEPSVARKLSCTPEYQDEPAASGLIKIVGVIADGTHRHVINILKLAADLGALGIFDFPGISRDILTKAAIYHDLCKTQPVLNVGDMVNPAEVFPPGKLHARLGADMGYSYYKLGDEVCNIIRYHHHEENELPSDFPSHLLPQLRLFKLLDGLSAGMTRRNASVRVGFEGGRVYISEKSLLPKYSGSYALNLYGGERIEIVEEDSHLIYRTQRLKPAPAFD
ncbi:MAG: HD domain-containing protein [Firmicutes bacterium]|nr:HD domain-containing protein [Bacillota bacterium]